MNQLGSFEDIGEKGQSAVKNAVKSTQKGASNFVQTAAGQTTNSTASDAGIDETNASGASAQQMSDDDAQKFLQDLYGVKNPTQNQHQPSQPLQGHALQNQKQAQNQQTVKAALGLTGLGKSHEKAPTPKETIKAALGIPEGKPSETAPTARETIKTALGIPEIGKQEKTPEELAQMQALRRELHGEYYQKLTHPTQAAQESVVDKLEREDQEEELADLETNKEKPPPIAVQRVQQSAEKFRGVSG